MTNIKTVLKPCPFCGTEPILTEIPPHSHKSGIANFMPDHPGSFTVECPKCSCGMIDTNKDSVVRTWNTRAVLAASAPAQEPIYWEYRHLDTCNEPHKWGEWERVDKSKGTLADLRQYIASGYKYELRALYAAPVDAQDAVDAKRYRVLRDAKMTFLPRITDPLDDRIGYYPEGLDKICDKAIALQASQSPQVQVKP